MRRPLLVGLWLVMAAWGVTAQKAGDEAAVKAALLYNFVKFTEWRGLPAGAPVVLCIVGDSSVWAAVVDAVKGQQVGGRTIDVRRPSDGTEWTSCQVLFVAGTEVSRSSIALGRLRYRPVLTVSDDHAFARTGGIIEVYREGDRMRFAINAEAAERAGLRISSRLLGLAKIIRGTSDP